MITRGRHQSDQEQHMINLLDFQKPIQSVQLREKSFAHQKQ